MPKTYMGKTSQTKIEEAFKERFDYLYNRDRLKAPPAKSLTHDDVARKISTDPRTWQNRRRNPYIYLNNQSMDCLKQVMGWSVEDIAYLCGWS